jgi:hypothetical protein
MTHNIDPSNRNLYPILEESSNIKNIVETNKNNSKTVKTTSRSEFVNYVVDENMKKMNRIINSSESRSNKMKKAVDILAYTTMCLNTVGVGASASGFGTAISGFGIPVAIPLGIIAATAGLFSGICSVVQTKLSEKVIKKSEQMKDIYEIRTKINMMYSKGIADDFLDETEFKNLMNLMIDFDLSH